MKNCRAHTGYIEDFKEPFGVALGLHVCGACVCKPPRLAREDVLYLGTLSGLGTPAASN